MAKKCPNGKACGDTCIRKTYKCKYDVPVAKVATLNKLAEKATASSKKAKKTAKTKTGVSKQKPNEHATRTLKDGREVFDTKQEFRKAYSGNNLRMTGAQIGGVVDIDTSSSTQSWSVSKSKAIQDFLSKNPDFQPHVVELGDYDSEKDTFKPWDSSSSQVLNKKDIDYIVAPESPLEKDFSKLFKQKSPSKASAAIPTTEKSPKGAKPSQDKDFITNVGNSFDKVGGRFEVDLDEVHVDIPPTMSESQIKKAVDFLKKNPDFQPTMTAVATQLNIDNYELKSNPNLLEVLRRAGKRKIAVILDNGDSRSKDFYKLVAAY